MPADFGRLAPGDSGRKSLKPFGAPDTNRTCDLPLRRGLLYPLSYRGASGNSTLSKFAFRFCAALSLASAAAQSRAWDDGSVPFVVTPPEVVARMLRIAEVGADDTLIDLGSGDGRIAIATARRGARALGVDNDPGLVRLATENAKQAGVSDGNQMRTYPWTAQRVL